MNRHFLLSCFGTIFFAIFFTSACAADGPLEKWIASRARPLSVAADMDELIDRAGDAKLVLLGEASHGTHEYYAWRDSISRRLISEKGFRFIAVEGDWASLYELNRYVKDMPGAADSALDVLMGLDRWPMWMWGNREVLGLIEWLRSTNDGSPSDQKVGFYGMDVYDEWRSKRVLKAFLKEHHPGMYGEARDLLDCFSAFDGDSWMYAQAVARGRPDCTAATGALVALLREGREDLAHVSDEDYFYAMQNALVVKYAEQFYRKAVTRQDASSWNSRVRYMHLCVSRLLEAYGPEAKGIVWAHNTHIGDARFTEMYHQRQENIGQLSRLKHGPEEVFLIGFGTYEGTVKAGAGWGERMQRMQVPEARPGSIETVLKEAGPERFYLLFDDADRTHEAFMEPMGNRAIGVTYNPRNDRFQYVMTIVPLRYDALIFFRRTQALESLHP